MRYAKYSLLLALIFMLTSCYHAKISTDKDPSAKVIDKPWAHSFVFGLVPPAEIDASEECQNGVAMVETKISFLNGLVSGLTFQLYTPMHITVTCASGSGMSAVESGEREAINVAKNSTGQEVAQTIQQAAKQSKDTKEPVYLKFE